MWAEQGEKQQYKNRKAPFFLPQYENKNFFLDCILVGRQVFGFWWEVWWEGLRSCGLCPVKRLPRLVTSWSWISITVRSVSCWLTGELIFKNNHFLETRDQNSKGTFNWVQNHQKLIKVIVPTWAWEKLSCKQSLYVTSKLETLTGLIDPFFSSWGNSNMIKLMFDYINFSL